ncbi:pyridoxal kinase PdxY [Paracoccus sp. 1_MG-2023]|uniref:pyridoxal kinase PdxY n=1 Tax=unclassified Paracoccus (in: a-proteobacteria) TaxID=2688777 RepID=UPI001C08A8D1|nr:MULTISPECIES: pyridoxal kinase PdxY [unclassified Paracoccus (in: a-proteobacteria)]MBU2957067.1 pyridoxal kinase PdxY [Paracoccus sp. C2R09]MDO6668265.1 pyridoxal kinase PdxY [Paracoccus sp. 1_MG-2023]
MNILSIQSHVAYGHAGNAAAVFPMQRLGVEVWPVHTVQFSNHTGYGDWKGRVFDGPAVEEIVEGIADRGVLPGCDGVISGYMGSSDIGNAVIHAAEAVRAANPKAMWCCDPVIGDVGRGIFVRPGIPEFMRDIAVPAADIVTPNHFELEFLTGTEIRDLPALRAALAALHGTGPRVILATSVLLEDTPADAIDMVASTGDGQWRVRTPRLQLNANGTGDMVAALFFVHFLRSGDAAQALGAAAASVHGVLSETVRAGTREIRLIAAQDEFVSPTQNFAPEKLG